MCGSMFTCYEFTCNGLNSQYQEWANNDKSFGTFSIQDIAGDRKAFTTCKVMSPIRDIIPTWMSSCIKFITNYYGA